MIIANDAYTAFVSTFLKEKFKTYKLVDMEARALPIPFEKSGMGIREGMVFCIVEVPNGHLQRREMRKLTFKVTITDVGDELLY